MAISSTTFSIPYQFAPLLDGVRRKIIEGSGRSSGKTTTTEMAIVTVMLSDTRNNVWYCRADKIDLRKTIFSSLWATIQAMGMERDFSYKLAPLEIRCRSTGAICYFSGINGQTEDDLNTTKGFVPRLRSLKMFVLDEANEVKCVAHLKAAETTANKFLTSDAKIVYMYNPPPLKTHWVHVWAQDEIRNGATDIYTTWQDIRGLLKPATIEEIEHMQRTDELFYRYWYLGECVNFAGMVYPQLKRERHCVNVYQLIANGDRFAELVLGLDEGTVNDSTCVTALAIMASGRAVVLDLYEYSPTDRLSNQGESGVLAPTEQSKKIFRFLEELLEKFPQLRSVPRRWIFESAEGGQILMAQFKMDYNEECGLVTQKSIWGDVKRVRNMLAEDILYFHIAPNVNTQTLVQDMENYVIDDRTNDIKKNQREDTIDSLEYATKLYYDRPIGRKNYNQWQ